ncbi:MAG: hypothetical protein GXO64_01215 [Candidatus Micrarchaeota archaeon]|nr:hypothetical protein [Candidatus Micrarchaeota archaeon]
MKLFGRLPVKKKEDIEKIKEIRNIVDGSHKNQKMAEKKILPPPLPLDEQKPMPSLSEHKTESPVQVPKRPVEKHASPPLFIKIERYREIVKQIQDLRSTALTLRDALDALFEMEREIKAGLDIAQKTLDKFNTTLLALDGSLIRSQGIDVEPAEESKELEEYIRKIYSQVERIRTDMKTISSDI